MNKCDINLLKAQTMAKDNETKKKVFETKDLIFMAVVVGIYFLFRTVTYNTILSYVFQCAIVCTVWSLYLLKPIMSFPVVLILNVLPNQIFYATNSDFKNHYSLNAKMVFIMLLLMVAYRLIVVQKGKIISGLNATTFIPMVILMGVSLFWADTSSYYSSNFYMILLTYIAFPLFMRDEYDVNVVWLSICISGGIYALSLIGAFREFGNIYEIGAMTDRNYLAMFGVMSITFFTNFAGAKHEKKYRVLTILSIIISMIIAWLVFSFASRTAFILLIAFIVLYTLMSFRDNKSPFLIVSAVVVMALMVYNSDITSFLFERFGMSSLIGGNGRVSIALSYIDTFLEGNIAFKLLGHGYCNLFDTVAASHNVYLGILLDFGLICFIFFSIIIVRILCNLWKSRYRHFIVAFVVFMVYMVTLDIHTNPGGACFLAAFAGISDVVKRSRMR